MEALLLAGTIDDVRYAPRCLSPEEIRAIYTTATSGSGGAAGTPAPVEKE